MKITKYEKYMYIFILLLASTVILNYGFTFAKYVANNAWSYYLKSKSLYFASDYLNINGVDNINNEWDGNSVYFNLKNNLNQQQITEDNITYEVTCEVLGDPSSYTTCEVNNSNNASVTGTLVATEACFNRTGDLVDVTTFNETACTSGGYEWESQIVTNNLFFDLTTNNNEPLDNVEVLITASSSDPYSETLTGTFKLKKTAQLSSGVYGTYQTLANYDRLIITNPSNETACINVSFDATKLLIDASSTDFSSVNSNASGNIESFKLNVLANHSISYQFYKANPENTYNLSEFTITNTTGC